MDAPTDFGQVFSLITDILNARPSENAAIKQFAALIKEDFSAFCDSVPGLNQMKDVEKFERVQNEMRLIANCPPLHSKMVGAIGGGFSSGKSSFVNSFMPSGAVQLATGVVPVTAIPSYVICDQRPSITGISYRGGAFAIKDDTYRAIKHELLKSLQFDLKQILRYVTVRSNLDPALFGNLCLIDTPGYNAPGSGTTEHDKETAFSYIKDAKFLIWLVGLDSNGTLNDKDLAFLEDLPFGQEDGKDLYIVLNKAGVVKETDRLKLLEEFKTLLVDFNYAGISVYDSEYKQEYLYERQCVRDFLKSQNVSTKKYVELAIPLQEIFDRYEAYVQGKHQADTAMHQKVRKLILDGLQSNAIKTTSNVKSKLEDGLNELERHFRPSDIDSSLQKIEELRKKFFACIDAFCDEMGIEKVQLSRGTGASGGASVSNGGSVRQRIANFEAELSSRIGDFSKTNLPGAAASHPFGWTAGVDDFYMSRRSAAFAQPTPATPATGNATVRRKRFCDKCGTKLGENHRFCPKCGTSTEL